MFRVDIENDFGRFEGTWVLRYLGTWVLRCFGALVLWTQKK